MAQVCADNNTMAEHRNIHDIVTELRAHPDARAVIVWVDEDAGDFDPDTVNWEAVEDRCCEIGHDVIHDTGSPAT